MFSDALHFWNPWWRGDTACLDRLVDRPSHQDVRPWFERKEVLAISGVRRSGKTSLMHLLIRECLNHWSLPTVSYLAFQQGWGQEKT